MVQNNFKSTLYHYLKCTLVLFLTNIAALINHIVIRILVIISMFIGFDSSAIKSEEDRLSRMAFQYRKSWVILLVAIVAYFIFGLIIKKHKNKLYNFLSVSGVSILGVILGIACFFKIKFIGDFSIYKIYSFYVPFMLNNFDSNFQNCIDIFINIIFILIPSLFMWLGNQVSGLNSRRLEHNVKEEI